MSLRNYLDYLIDTIENDQLLGLGSRSSVGMGTIILDRGTYVWKLDNRFRNARGYRLKLRHAASGNSGAFNFVVYNDKHDLGKPTTKNMSPLMSKNSGQTSQWSFSSIQEQLFIGLNIPNNNTSIYLNLTKAPTGFRGLDPHWMTGPRDASGSSLEPGEPGDVNVVFTPGNFDDGSRFPGITLEPLETGENGLARYYHLDFSNNDNAPVREVNLCSEMIADWIATYPSGVVAFDSRSDWQAANPGGTDRGYLDYLLDRLTKQPLNIKDPDTLPDRLTSAWHLNFRAPESSEQPRLQFLVNILQADLLDRGIHFDDYQAWRNSRDRQRFPENFYTYWNPLIEPNEIPANRVAQVRSQLPRAHSTQVAIECLERTRRMDDTLTEARVNLVRGELFRSKSLLQSAEADLGFLLRHQYGINSKMTTSRYLQNLDSEKLGTMFTPAIRDQMNDRAMFFVHPELGNTFSNIGRLLNPNVTTVAPVAGMNESPMYTRRRNRSRSRLDSLMQDVEVELPAGFDSMLSEIVDNNGNMSTLSTSHKNTVRNMFRDLWLTVPHYLFFVLPLDYGECYFALGEHQIAERYYQLVFDFEQTGLAARSTYRYLNREIEIPYLAIKHARNIVTWGDKLQRRGGQENLVRARSLFNQAMDLIDQHVHSQNPGGQQLKYAAQNGLVKLNSNFNALGYPNNFVPVFRYQYLIQLADEMVRHAVDAGRQTVTFMQQAEAAVRGELEAAQAISVNEALTALEALRMTEAQARLEIAQLQRNQIDQEISNLDAKIEELSDPVFFWAAVATGVQSGLGFATAGAAVGGPIGVLAGVVIGGFASSSSGPGAALGGTIGGAVGGLIGIAGGGLLGAGLGYAQGAAQWKAHQSNLNDQIRSRGVLQDFGIPIADKQIDVALIGQQIAAASHQIALLRTRHARELSAVLETQLFNAERLYELARQMREIYATYLRYANEVAFLAEQSLEFEINEPVDVIRFDYNDSPVAGVLGAEQLQSDLDTLKHSRVKLYDQKRLPVTSSISLREEFPLAFFSLIQNGEASFHTSLDYFSRLYPGTYQQRISRVELVFYALVPQEGLHGSLSSSGISYVRNDRAEKEGISVGTERIIISRYRIQDGQAFFFDTREHYHSFEGMGVATDWTLSLPKSSNDINYANIFDIHLVLHYTTLIDDELAQQDLASFPPLQQSAQMVSLRKRFPDSYYHLGNEGNATFRLDRELFPPEHHRGEIKRVMLLYQLDEEHKIRSIESELKFRPKSGSSRQASVNLDLQSPGSSAGNQYPFAGMPITGDWEVFAKFSDSASNSLPLDALQDVHFLLEYEYQRESARYRLPIGGDTTTIDSLRDFDARWTLAKRGAANTVKLHSGVDGSMALEIRNNGGASAAVQGPVVKGSIDPIPISPNTVVQWTQKDLEKSMDLVFHVIDSQGTQHELRYSATDSRKWARPGYAVMSQQPGKIGAEQSFSRRIYSDFIQVHSGIPVTIVSVSVAHSSNKKFRKDHGCKLANLQYGEAHALPFHAVWKSQKPGRLELIKTKKNALVSVDTATPGVCYHVAMKMSVSNNDAIVTVWFAGGLLKLELQFTPRGSAIVQQFKTPYGSRSVSEVAKGKFKPPKPGSLFWLQIRRDRNEHQLMLNDQEVAGFVARTRTSSSEFSIGSDKTGMVLTDVIAS